MITELKRSYPTAKKEHKCMYCGGIIKVGEKYERQTNKYDNQIYDWVCHLECQEVTGLLNMFDYDYGEGINEVTFQECVGDYINEHHYNYDTDQFDEGWDGLSVYDAVLKIKEELLKSL